MLQILDAAADRGLSDAELIRRLGEAASRTGGEKKTKVVPARERSR